MIAMQYRFDFPDGTDMAPIHRRVVEKGPGFDCPIWLMIS